MSDCRIPHSPGIVNASQSQRGMVPTMIRRFERPNETAGYNFATVSFSSRIGWLPALRSQSGCWHTRVTLKRPPRRIPSLQLDKREKLSKETSMARKYSPSAASEPMMAEQVLLTVAAISELAGVSKSTVSRALNNNSRISEKTRDRIWKIANEFRYAPNAIAKSLATQRSHIIGFIGSVEPNYWYQEKIQVLVSASAAVGMQTMMFQVPGDTDIAGIYPIWCAIAWPDVSSFQRSACRAETSTHWHITTSQWCC